MNAIEAMIYCLGAFSDQPSGGCFHSRTVYDCNGEPHWVQWATASRSTPRPCSESPTPFSRDREPYRMSRENQ